MEKEARKFKPSFFIFVLLRNLLFEISVNAVFAFHLPFFSIIVESIQLKQKNLDVVVTIVREF